MVDVDPQLGIDALVREIKRTSARELRDRFPAIALNAAKLRASGYFVSSAGTPALDAVEQYIADKKFG